MLLLLLFVIGTFVLTAQEIGDVIDTQPPSENTWNEIEQMSQGPSLRARPGDIHENEKPNKVPLSNVSYLQIALLGISFLTHQLYKNNKRRETES